MAQTVTTYNFSKKQNSTKYPPANTGSSHTVVLKDPTSLIHPVFILEGFSRLDNYLKWGDRYYFITDIVQRTNDTAEYHCIVDPLASWKTQIGQQEEYVLRAASAHDGSIIDGSYPVTSDITQDSVNFTNLGISGVSSGCYVVGVVGYNSSAVGSIAYYVLSPTEFAALVTYMFNGTWLDFNETDISIATQKMLVNPMQYIVSCVWYPFTITSVAGSGSIWFGWWDSGITASFLDPAHRQFFTTDIVTVPRHPQRGSRGRYLSCEPFSEYILDMWCFGRIPLDPSYFVQHSKCSVGISVDLFTGGSTLSIYANEGTDQILIHKTFSQMGIPIQLAQLTQDLVQPIIDVVGGAANMVTQLDFRGFAQGIWSAVQTMMPQLSVQGSTGCLAYFWFPATLYALFRYQTDMDNTHRGRPVCDNLRINTLSGFIQCDNVQVDIPCTQEERDIIQHFMESGFYYE
jgi:hypothetical protein